MASSKSESQITWSTSNTKTLSTNSWVISDELLFNVEDWSGMIQFRADNSGTPASGDTVEIRYLYTVGDLDNGGGPTNDYPDANTSGSTVSRSELAVLLDTYNNYDPDGSAVPVNTAAKGVKIAARAAQGATRAIVLSARFISHRPQ